MSRSALPGHLHAAHEWIASAGEWTEAVGAPAKYAKAAAKNFRENPSGAVVTESDLRGVIAWKKRGRSGPSLTEA